MKFDAPTSVLESGGMSWKISMIDRCDSTQMVMENCLKGHSTAEGWVVQTNFQSNGKGQREHRWEADAGENLLMSLLLKPSFLEPENQFVLSQVISLSLHQTISKYLQRELYIKWPNDIWVGSAKIAGILISHLISAGQLQHSIIGIGVNINQLHFKEFRTKAISFRQITGLPTEVNLFRDDLLHSIAAHYQQLRSGRMQHWNKSYESLLFGYRKKMKLRDATGVFEGIILGVDPYGRLKVQGQNNQKQLYSSGELIFLS